MTRHTFLALTSTVVLSLSGCGLFEPDYENYASDAGGTPDDPCVTAALAEFATQIAPAVDGTCASSSCHSVFSIAGKPLAIGDDATNRAQLLAFSGKDAGVLFDKISLNGKTHTGGDQKNTLPKANIEAWLAKEICN